MKGVRDIVAASMNALDKLLIAHSTELPPDIEKYCAEYGNLRLLCTYNKLHLNLLEIAVGHPKIIKFLLSQSCYLKPIDTQQIEIDFAAIASAIKGCLLSLKQLKHKCSIQRMVELSIRHDQVHILTYLLPYLLSAQPSSPISKPDSKCWYLVAQYNAVKCMLVLQSPPKDIIDHIKSEAVLTYVQDKYPDTPNMNISYMVNNAFKHTPSNPESSNLEFINYLIRNGGNVTDHVTRLIRANNVFGTHVCRLLRGIPYNIQYLHTAIQHNASAVKLLVTMAPVSKTTLRNAIIHNTSKDILVMLLDALGE
tara:strand:+ start:14445 stop:15371 length:927 start_codon:yes stop_codon:yes gene_type:complete